MSLATNIFISCIHNFGPGNHKHHSTQFIFSLIIDWNFMQFCYFKNLHVNQIISASIKRKILISYF